MCRIVILCFGFAAAGCSSSDKELEDGTVTPESDPPVVSILSPASGDQVPPGELTAVEATLSDDETPVGDLVVTIESSTSGAIEHDGTIDADGVFTAEVLIESGTQTITVAATDGDDNTGSDSVELTANGAPSAPSIAIEPDLPEEEDDLQAVVTDESTDPDDDEVTYEWAWTVQVGIDGTPSPFTHDGDPQVVPAENTTKGQVWTVTATPTDSNGNTGEDATAFVVVDNSPPSLADATLSPDPAYTEDDITVTPSGWDDVDGDEEQYVYSWTVNGEEVADVEGPILSYSNQVKGDQVEVSVTPFDGFVYGDPIVAGPLSISNTPPSAMTVSLSPASPSTTDTIESVVVGWSDPDGDEEMYEYRWYIDEELVLDATGPTLDAELTSHFQSIVLEVTPFDGEDVGDPIYSEALSIENTVPEITNVELSPNPITTIDTVTATPSGWADIDDDPATYIYQWTINGVEAGEDSETLSPSLTTRGDTIQCTVTPSDGTEGGEGPPISSETMEVVNSRPTVASNSITPTTAVVGDTLTCAYTAFSDPDGDDDQTTIAWFKGGIPIGSGPVLTRGFVGGDEIGCVVIPYDGIEYGPSVEATIVIGNTAPSISSVSISPETAQAGDVLTCSWEGFEDVDLDVDASQVEWTVNGSRAGTEPTFSGDFVDGDVVTCIVTPNDGEDTGPPLSSSITIINTPPSIESVSINPTEADYSTTLTCTWDGYSDPDGHVDATGAEHIEWVDGDGTVLGSGPTLSGAFTGGDTVECRVTPYDGTELGEAVTSDSINIENTPPTLDSAGLLPLEPTVESTMVCSPGPGTDPDGTTDFTYTYRWAVGGVEVPGETGSTLTAPAFARGNSVVCYITISDGIDSGDEVSSNIETILNSRPVIDSLEIGPEDVQTNDVITAEAEVSDADGDPIFLTFEWKVNGIIVDDVAEDSNVLNGITHFDKGDSVQVTAIPTEGGGDGGLPVVSNTIVVSNTAPGAPVIEIEPLFPQPEDNLECIVVEDAPDVDFDALTYSYTWYRDGVETGETGSVIPASITEHAQHWECEVTAFDDEDEGGSESTSVVVNDTTDPDPPLFDDLSNHVNQDEQTLSGECEADCTVDIYCDDDLGTTEWLTTCNELGRFSADVDLDRGSITSCVATCTDLAGNVSGMSSAHMVESCDPYDIYEDETDYGDGPSSVVDEWSPISDDGLSVIEIKGNVLDEDEDDWFVISTADDLASDLAAGIDLFNFHVELTSGLSNYRFVVHHGGSGAGDLECPTVDGYSEYNWFVQDVGDGSHSTPSETRSCRPSDTEGYNDCEDNSDDFYIHVYRIDGSDCSPYELTITNGAW